MYCTRNSLHFTVKRDGEWGWQILDSTVELFTGDAKCYFGSFATLDRPFRFGGYFFT